MTDGTTCGILGHSRRPGRPSAVHLPRVAAVLWAAAVLVIVGLWPAMAAEVTTTRFTADTAPVAATPGSTSPNPAGETFVTAVMTFVATFYGCHVRLPVGLPIVDQLVPDQSSSEPDIPGQQPARHGRPRPPPAQRARFPQLRVGRPGRPRSREHRRHAHGAADDRRRPA